MGFFDRFFMRKAFQMGNFIPHWMIGRPIWKEWDYQNAILEGYKKNSLVYSCVDKIAKSASSVDWYVYRKKADGSYEVIQNHPLEQLIAKPNPYMSRRDFITRWTHSMFLGGNSLTLKIRDGKGKVIEMWYLPQDTTSPVPSAQNFVEKYEYDYNGIKKDIKPFDIIHDSFIDPSNLYWGMSPLKSASMLIDSDNEAVLWNKTALSQRAISDGAFIIDQPLTQEQWTETKSQIETEHSGSQNARKFWVLGAGAKWQPMSLSPVEMDFIQSKKLNREDICSIFGVPPSMIGFYENATLANIETARKVFWLDTIIPFLNGIRDCFNSSLALEYGDVYIDYDTSTVDALQVNIADKIANATSLFSMGVPFNKINTLLDMGLDEIEGGDIGYLPSNLIPMDSIGEVDASNGSTGTPPNEDDKPPSEDDAQDDEKDPNLDDEKESNTKLLINSEMFLKANLSMIPKKEIHLLNIKARAKLPYETRMSSKMTSIFENMSTTVSANPSNWEKAIDSFDKEILDLMINTWKAIFEDIGKSEYTSLLNQSKDFMPFDESKINIFQALFDKTILNWIKSTCAEKVTGIQKFTKSKIAKTISNIEESYMNNGERAPVDAIAKGIKDKFKEFSRYRSFLIARTEVGSATETASYQAQNLAQQQIDPSAKKLVVKRKWLSALDERTRETHLDAHGQVRGLEEKFEIGDVKLMFPRDYDADAPNETINCRCTTTSFVERVDK